MTEEDMRRALTFLPDTDGTFEGDRERLIALRAKLALCRELGDKKNARFYWGIAKKEMAAFNAKYRVQDNGQ